MPEEIATRRAALLAQYGSKFSPAQIDAILADEALFRRCGVAVSAALQDNGEMPFVPLFPEQP